MQFDYTSKMLTNRLNSQNALSNRSITKLSSGKQINTAADNAAGMSISQKMKAMIRGLSMADRNIQDGINLVNVADQALGNMADPLLVRLKQLSVQASNDTLNNDDRMMIQQEIESILDDIDTIANSTEFNGIYLLNGAKPGDTGYGQSNTVEFDYKDVLKLPGESSNGRLDLRTDKGYPTTSADNNQILAYNGGSTSYPSVQIGDKNFFLNKPMGSSASSSDASVNSCRVENGAYITEYKINDGTGIDVTVNQIVTIDKDKYDIKYEIKNNSSSNLPIGFRFNLDTDIAGDDRAKFIVGGSDVINETKYEGSSIPDEFTVYNKDGASNKVQALGQVKGEGIIKEPSGVGFGRWKQGVENPDWVPADTTISDSAYSVWWDKENIGSGDTLTVNTRFGLSIPPTIEAPGPIDDRAPYDLMLQVGANAGEQFKVKLSDVRTASILPDEVDISIDIGRKQFMESVDKAAAIISAERVRYGTYSNALEHIDSNVNNYNENMTSSLSRVEDTDMAKEMLEKSKYDILSSANFNMMTQAMKMNESMANIVTLWNSK